MLHGARVTVEPVPFCLSLKQSLTERSYSHTVINLGPVGAGAPELRSSVSYVIYKSNRKRALRLRCKHAEHGLTLSLTYARAC